MRIRFTKHAAKDKFATLARHGFQLTKKSIKETIIHPDHIEPSKHPDQKIASKTHDDLHDLRDVYRREDDILLVITFYPTRKGRYLYEN